MYLNDLYGKDVYRKQYISKFFLEKIIPWLKNSDCKKLRWQVSKWNISAIDFYKKMNVTIDETDINCNLLLV
ncbi:GNAT family N-acetyltransferase [Ferruginibacter sp.]|uniref:GNAT family N-acetyltransferase n=1 Tax=Ferruginibacter sp. TaxID=1940288 RepID=UPI00349E7FF3